MRKLRVLLLLFSFVSCALFAQETQMEEASGVLQNIQQQKIEKVDLPEKIRETVRSKFVNYSIAKAAKGKIKGKPVYKLKLENEESVQIIILSANGKILESEKNLKRRSPRKS